MEWRTTTEDRPLKGISSGTSSKDFSSIINDSSSQKGVLTRYKKVEWEGMYYFLERRNLQADFTKNSCRDKKIIIISIVQKKGLAATNMNILTRKIKEKWKMIGRWNKMLSTYFPIWSMIVIIFIFLKYSKSEKLVPFILCKI